MTYRYVTQRDLDGTWSVLEEGTGRYALFRGSPLAGLSEKSAAMRAERLNGSAPLRAELPPLSQEGSLWPFRPALHNRVTRPVRRLH
jgi:hypothetical protein